MMEFDLKGFAAHLAKIAASEPRMSKAALEFAAQVVHAEAVRVIGTYDYGWPQLRQATLDRKSADTPLLETGEMRDSIRHKANSKIAHIGSNNDKAVWQELGTRRGIPPRPFLAGALNAKIDDVLGVIGVTVATAIATGNVIREHNEFERWAHRFVEHGLKHAARNLREAWDSLTEEQKKGESE